MQQARYLYGLSDVQGDAKILGLKPAEFLDRVRAYKKRPSQYNESALVREKDAILSRLTDEQKLVFQTKLNEILETP